MLKNYSLLYVEDNDETVRAFHSAFGEYFKIIHIAKDGEEGLDLYEKNRPDIVLTDIQMPKIGGLEMISRMRESSPNLPIIVNSAFSDTHLLIKAIALHVDSYILKPTNPHLLLTALEKIARILTLEKSLDDSRKMTQTIMDEMPDPILYILPDHTVSMMNKAAKEFSGDICDKKSPKCYEIYHQNHVPCNGQHNPCSMGLIHTTKKPVKLRQIHTDVNGLKHDVDVHTKPIFDQEGAIIAYLETTHDMTEYVSIQNQLDTETKKLQHLSMHDALTHLPNRRLLDDRINHMVQNKSRSGELFAIFFVDLDHFKEVNDSLGHLTGDLLLIQVAKRLQDVIRKGDTIARTGGDEFVLIIDNGASDTHFAAVAEKIQKQFKEPFLINEQKIFSSCSIGISIYPQDGQTAELLLSSADAAMYASKEAGRHQFGFYASGMADKANDFIRIGSELKSAIENNELVLFYQPLYEVNTKTYTSMEALIRWNHPEKGLISPIDFLSIAQKSGLMIEIDLWVIQTVLDTFNDLVALNIAPQSVSANITTETLFMPNFITLLLSMIESSGVDPKHFVLEIVENQLMQDIIFAKEIIQELHKIGIKVALDDFGTGYSSLSYLLDFDVDILKIDQSFIRKIGIDKKGATVIKSIVSLSKALGLKTVAEGVETDQQQQFLAENGVSFIQGYIHSRPINKENLINLLENKLQ